LKRYRAFDPPEYIDWLPDEEVMADWKGHFADDPRFASALEELGRDGLERLYRGLLRARLHDIALKRWVRTGVLTKAWLGYGEEATTVGAVHALEEGDTVGPMIRNASATFERGMPLEESFRAYLGSGESLTKGRDLHFGSLEHGVIAPISHVGDLVPVLCGFALAFKLRNEPRVALTWVGDGATRTGAVHEGIALASNRSLPLIVIIQDNAVALGTIRDESFARSLEGMAAAYDCNGLTCDGNNVIDVYAKVRQARRLCIDGEGPVLLLSHTFRFGGHATHDEAEARDLFSQEVFDHWAKRDPVGCFEIFLIEHPEMLGGVEVKDLLATWEEEVIAEVEAAAGSALEGLEKNPPDPEEMLGDVFASGSGDLYGGDGKESTGERD